MATEPRGTTLQQIGRLFAEGLITGLSDAALLERFLTQRDGEAFDALVSRHGPMVLSVCRGVLRNPADAEDAFQATFLVLVKKAGSIRKRDVLAGWLYQVAQHVARRANVAAARRQAHERQVAKLATETSTADPAARDELLGALHHEIARLPHKYRLAVVLCDLEGLPQAEAALQLRWSERTVRRRLAEARRRLQRRLTRRGLEPDQTIIGAMCLREARAAVPTVWRETAVRTALGALVSAGTASVATQSLVTEVLRVMLLRKLQWIALGLLGSGLMAWGMSPALLSRADEPTRAAPPPVAVAQQTAPSPAPQPPAPQIKTAELAPPQGTVVDGEGRPLAGVAVFLSAGSRYKSDGSIPCLGRATTDKNGHFVMAAPPLSAFKGSSEDTLWAFKAGLALGTTSYDPVGDRGPFQIRLIPPAMRSVTLKRRDGAPAAGVKVVPSHASVRIAGGGSRGADIPDELAELLARVSDANGQVTFSCFGPADLPTGVRVWSAAGALQAVAPSRQVPADADTIDIVVEPAGALAGKVLRSDGKSSAGLIVRVESSRAPGGLGLPVRFKEGPIRVAADGRFQTPPVLLEGWRYRVSIQAEGQGPVASPWIEPAGAGKTATLADLVLNALQEVVGRVLDRQGRPVAGAEVFQSGDGPEQTTTHTDANGQFRLGGYVAARGLVFARARGFRFGGRVVSPDENTIVLTRVTEAPERSLSLLPPPLPAAELRVLARRVLDPYLQRALQEGPPYSAARPLEVLAILDPAAALEKLPGLKLGASEGRLRATIAAEFARRDVQKGTAVAEAAPEPNDRARALLAIADILPSEPKLRRLELLGKAVVHARASTKPDEALWWLGEVGERLVEYGELEKAKPVFQEGAVLARTLAGTRNRRLFAARLASVDVPGALALIDKIPDLSARSRALGNAAIRLARRQPAECEQLLRRIDARERGTAIEVACHQMAPVDPDRARRLVDEHPDPHWRGTMRIGLAHGLAKTSRTEAEKAFREALVELGTSARRDDDLHCVYLLLSLPFVEGIDPALVPEFLWQALSLRLPSSAEGPQTWRSSETVAATVVAQYDRALAATLWGPVVEQARFDEQDDSRRYRYQFVIAEAQFNPIAAVERVESTPRMANIGEYGQNDPRLILSDVLAHWAQGRPQRLLPHFAGLVEICQRRDLP